MVIDFAVSFLHEFKKTKKRSANKYFIVIYINFTQI